MRQNIFLHLWHLSVFRSCSNCKPKFRQPFCIDFFFCFRWKIFLSRKKIQLSENEPDVKKVMTYFYILRTKIFSFISNFGRKWLFLIEKIKFSSKWTFFKETLSTWISLLITSFCIFCDNRPTCSLVSFPKTKSVH